MFGVACKLPPSLTILILNGCFCFPIGWHAIWGVSICGYELKNVKCAYDPLSNSEEQGTDEIDTIEDKDDITHIEKGSSKRFLKCLRTIIELVAFLMQLGVLVSIPFLLSIEQFFEPSEISKHHFIATYILIPISLISISVVWSGWIQDVIMKPQNTIGQFSDGKGNITARYKTGN